MQINPVCKESIIIIFLPVRVVFFQEWLRNIACPSLCLSLSHALSLPLFFSHSLSHCLSLSPSLTFLCSVSLSFSLFLTLWLNPSLFLCLFDIPFYTFCWHSSLILFFDQFNDQCSSRPSG